MKQYTVILLTVGFGLAMTFQNCSKVAFKELNAQDSLVAVDGEPSDTIPELPEEVPVVIDTPVPPTEEPPVVVSEPPVISEPPVTEEPPVVVTAPTPSDDDDTCDDKGRGKHSRCNTPERPTKPVREHAGKPDGAHGFICILEGSGKSQKVGLASEMLIAQNGTPRDVCMSEVACNDIISQKFVVKGPVRRGFCPNKNPHVVEMSDEQVQSLVDALK